MNFYITTPIYYANAELHIGHGYTSVITDVLKRYHTLFREESFFLTGMDEHGAKLEESALAQGKTPQQLCDENYLKFVESLKTLSISYNYFIRTTSERHKKGVQKLLNTLWNAKTPDGQPAIYQGKYEGLYCIGCEKFITEKELTPEGLCPDHLSKPKLVSENNWFFRLTSYLDKVEEHIRSGRIKIMPEGRRNEVLGLLKQGLNDFSISRERLNWGIDIPFDPTQKTYVWMDALPNYITAIGYGDDPEMFDKWWNNSQIVHLMGRDILKFHAIIWPALLMAAELRLPDIMFIHGYISLNGQKISKSLGNVISNEHLVAEFGKDAARYLLVSQFPFHLDGDISYPRLYEKYNSDLANDYGNLVSRVVKLTMANFDGKIPPQADAADEHSRELTDLIATTPQKVQTQIRDIDVLSAVESIWVLIRAANRYFDYSKPWELAKQGDKAKLAAVLHRSLEAVRIAATLTWPIMPEKSEIVFSMLGLDGGYQPKLVDAGKSKLLAAGTKLRPLDNIFPRLQARKEEKVEPTKPAVTELPEGVVTIDDFFKTKLVVAEVLACENVPETTKLLKLQIAIGEEKRQIVAGVAEFYKPEEMVGKKIVVVANLKPAKVRGIESNGMLLAAKIGKELKLVTVDGDIASGASVG
ncbi:MAG: methionine--tRNA ligase [Candidatus Zixiibacteriota bacterium]